MKWVNTANQLQEYLRKIANLYFRFLRIMVLILSYYEPLGSEVSIGVSGSAASFLTLPSMVSIVL